MGLTNWLYPLVFAAKYCCCVFLQKNRTLDEFHSYLVAVWGLLRGVTGKT